MTMMTKAGAMPFHSAPPNCRQYERSGYQLQVTVTQFVTAVAAG
jgi:hypothetical protein